jgi:hypothetical protein
MLAVVGGIYAARRRDEGAAILWTWLGLGIIALYVPISLQRRLSLGLWMPIVLLAVTALRDVIWPRVAPHLRPVLVGALVIAVLPTNLLVYAAGLGAVRSRDSSVFLTIGEAAAIDWLAQNAGTAVVAASPTLGGVIPARSDARVLYGHPFETVQASARRQALLEFYAGTVPAAPFVADNQIAYVLIGPRERNLGAALPLAGWPVAFQQDDVAIYAP